MSKHATIEIGDTVMWKAGGKVSRLDGVAGKTVYGTVESIDGSGDIHVRKDYESMVPKARLELDQILGVTLKDKPV